VNEPAGLDVLAKATKGRAPEATVKIRLHGNGSLTMIVSNQHVTITPSKSRTDLVIRCRGTEEHINSLLESGHTLSEIASEFVWVLDDDSVTWTYRYTVYHSFKDCIGKMLLEGGANIPTGENNEAS